MATKPVIVIAPDLYVIRDRIGPVCDYAIQEVQLGTGHAILSAKEKLLKYDHILVLYGDHPLVSARTIDELVVNHLQSGADLTLATLRLPHFDDWFNLFECYGRIIRGPKEELVAIVEKKEAASSERAITEVNPGYYIFRAGWLWSALPKLSRENVQHEYYLTDLVSLALQEGRLVRDIQLENPQEALGINTPEQLQIAEKIMQEKIDELARWHTRRLPL